MYLKGSKWSMNRRRQPIHWFRIILLTLLIAAGLYFDKYLLPSVPQIGAPTPTATRPPESFITQAQQLFEQGKLQQSIQAYEQAIAGQPNDPTTYVALAEVQVFAGDYKGAQASAENALLLDPNNTMAHAMRAWSLDFQNDTTDAQISIQKALDIDPRNAVAHAFYAEILADSGAENIPKAIQESQLAETLAPNTLITHRARGYILAVTGNYEDAAREYQAAISSNPNIPDLHIQLGTSDMSLGAYDQAIQEFAKANALDPANGQPDYLTSRVYFITGEPVKARQYAETSVSDDPTNARYHGNLGVMDYHNGMFTEAVKELSLAVKGGTYDDGQGTPIKVEGIELVPDSIRIAEIYFTYALALAKTGQCGETLQVAQVVQARIPTDDVSVTNVNAAIQICQQGISAAEGTTVPTSETPGPGTGTPAAPTRTPKATATP